MNRLTIFVFFLSVCLTSCEKSRPDYDDFKEKYKPTMNMADVYKLFGKPDRIDGRLSKKYIYELPENRSIVFGVSRQILYVHYLDENGKLVEDLRREAGLVRRSTI